MGIIVQCVRCGKDVERLACEAGKKYYYCSPQCRDTRRTKPCERCGALFVFRKCEETKRFCSKACHYGPRPRLTCEWCKVEFSVKRCDAWRKHCSRKCADEEARHRGFQEPPHVAGAAWIPLNTGRFTLIDAEDLALVSRHGWSESKSTRTRPTYACCRMLVRGESRYVGMHRLVLNHPDGEVDHINMNGLDNRKANLRVVNKSQQRMNQFKRNGCASIYRGVTRKRDKWLARVTRENQHFHAGVFVSEVDAALAYDKTARVVHGPFARLNFPGQGERSAHK